MEKNTRYCIFCGEANDAGRTSCAVCDEPLYPNENLLEEYLKKEAKEQLGDKIEDTIFEKLKAFLLSHLYGIAMTVAVVFTAAAAVSTLTASPVPSDARRIQTPPAVNALGYIASVEDDAEAGREAEPISAPSPTPTEADPSEVYYRYLKEVILPEYGLARIGSMDWTVPDLFSTSEGTLADLMSEYRDDPTGESGHGVLSAVVRDLDGDGIEDFLVLFLDRDAGNSTAVRTVYGSENVTVLRARLYTMREDDSASVYEEDYVPAIAELGGLCRGTVVTGIVTWEDVPYLYTYEWMEDATTYGPFLTRIYHVENGGLVLDSADGWIGWGQTRDVDDVNAYLGADGVSFAGTAVEEAYQLVASGDRALSIEEDPNLSRLEEPLARLVFSWTPGTSRGITTSIEDCSDVRSAMDSLPEAAADESAVAEPETPAEPTDTEIVSTVVFGAYEQDNDTSNGPEPIEWIVLDRDGENLLLISRYGLDCMPYHNATGAVTWETCSLRAWLNDTFWNEAFSEEEKALVLTTTVVADKSLGDGSDPGNDTQDKVFLLSSAEVEKYWPWPDNEAACTTPTAYAFTKGPYIFSWEKEEEKFVQYGNDDYVRFDGNTWWWLRSPGRTATDAMYINWNGDSAFVNVRYNYEGSAYTVRPALWVHLNG